MDPISGAWVAASLFGEDFLLGIGQRRFVGILRTLAPTAAMPKEGMLERVRQTVRPAT